MPILIIHFSRLSLRMTSTILGFLLIGTVVSCAESEQNSSSSDTLSIMEAEISSLNIRPGLTNDGFPIVGGDRAKLGDIPWQAFLDIRQGRKKWLCGGVILDEYNILTAAHCVVDKKNNPVKARQITVKYSGVKPSRMKSAKVKSVIPEHRYLSTSHRHDIALLQLKRPLKLSAVAQQALLQDESSEELLDRTPLTVSGFGSISENGPTSDRLLIAEVNYITRKRCLEESSYGNWIQPGMICAGFIAGGVDACPGDSGGPLILAGTNKLVGIVSWGWGCARPGMPGVYTDISYYRDWIESQRKCDPIGYPCSVQIKSIKRKVK